MGNTLFCACSIVFVFLQNNQGVGFVVLACLMNALGGVVNSILYISQYNYVSECSKADGQSKYFGIALGLCQSANVIGNLLSAYIV